MNFSLSLKRLVYGQHFFSGLFAAFGVIGYGLLWYALTDDATAIALSSGVLCVSLVDLPASLRHKRIDLLAAAIGGALVTLLVAQASSSPLTLGAAVLLIGFCAAMLTAFGKRAMPLSFSLLLAMVLMMGVAAEWRRAPLEHAALFLAGGLAYLVYGWAVAWWQRMRTKRQALAESLFELAEFARVSAGFFKEGADLEASYEALVAQQATVAEKQQGARDLVFEGLATDAERRLAGILRDAIDVYEYILASQTDHELLRRHYAGSDIMALLHDLTEKCAADLELIAYAILRHRAPRQHVRYLAELFALEHEIEHSPHAGVPRGADRHALEALKATVYKIRHVTQHIGRLHRALASDSDSNPIASLDPSAFVSPASYTLNRLRTQFKADSPVLRHALRTTLALACGVLIAHFLPHATHGYWIVLTIVVIMRSNFSVMRQRYGDRLMGNLIGCVAAALILHLDPHPAIIVALLFGCVTIAHTFVTINYRYTSIAACLLALLNLSFIDPAEFLVLERLADTAIGAALAYGFSFLLPSWEYKTMPAQIRNLLRACSGYANSILAQARDEHAYRLVRKSLFDAIATLSLAVRAMQREPKGAQRGTGPLQRLIADSYLLAAQLAAVRLILQERGSELDPQRATANLGAALERAQCQLRQALAHLGAQEPCAASGGASEVTAEGADWPPDWNMTTLLQRRLALMESAVAAVLADIRSLPPDLA